MIITFDETDRFRVARTDKYNYTLQERKTTPETSTSGKTNKHPGERWVDVGYHPNVGQAITSIIKLEEFTIEQEMTLSEYKAWFDARADQLNKFKIDPNKNE